jgi:glutamine cyclotransferase
MQIIGPGNSCGRRRLISSASGKIAGLFVCLLASSCHPAQQGKTVPADVEDYTAPAIPYRIAAVFPHDTSSFTEGLLVYEGQLFESTGHTDTYPDSRSLFGTVDMKNGSIQTKVEIDKKKYFGEGIVFLNGRIYQLTDTTRIGFIYDARTYKKLGVFHYDGEGWGLTTDGSDLLMSNGTSNISYRDPYTFRQIKILGVTDGNGPVNNLNELEWIGGFLYANRWLTDDILKIDPQTGKVLGKLDLSSLHANARSKYPGSAELNGIAYDSAENKIYITGKRWPSIYEIRFSH